jgi:hypothetical protein
MLPEIHPQVGLIVALFLTYVRQSRQNSLYASHPCRRAAKAGDKGSKKLQAQHSRYRGVFAMMIVHASLRLLQDPRYARYSQWLAVACVIVSRA